ncbi:MAG TPA: ABC transporter permease [Gammaproteobacteria bacterium]|nr:ABC transporter permease [Gammaproteobacteria bacterium]
MKFLPLIWRNLTRKKTRTVFTLLSVLCTFLLFGFLMAVRQGFVTGATLPGADLIFTLSKSGGEQGMPQSYGDRIAAVAGVADVMQIGGGGFYYQTKKKSVGVGAVEADTLFRMFPELAVPQEQRQKWIHDRIGAIVRDDVAKRYGWKVGDHIPLLSYSEPGKVLEVNIDGIQDTQSGNIHVGFGQVYVHFDYLRTWSGEDSVFAFIERAADPKQTSAVAERINAVLANSPVPSETSPMQAMVQGVISRFGDIGAIAVAVALAALIGMLIVTANTMAQSVRERIAELAAMRALGFSRTQLVGLVTGESLLLTAVGGLLGLGCAWGATVLLGPAVSKTVPGLYFSPAVLGVGVGLIVLLSLMAALSPSVRAVRLQVATALGSR